MKKLSFVSTLVFVSLFAFGASAQDVAVTTAPADGAYSPMVVGGYMAMGMAGCLGDTCSDSDAKMRFAGGGAAYFDFYFSEMLALDVGLGFIGRGARVVDGDVTAKDKILYMEVPVGLKLNFSGFQVGAGVAMFLAMSGKTTWKSDSSSGEEKWESESWDYHSRFNLGAKIFLGYAIPVGPIAIVPGLEWSMDLLNNAKGDAKDADMKWRYMNIMFRVGVDFGL
jgi:hypothetical protein